MPVLPQKPCRAPGCSALTRGGYCARHQQGREPDGRVRVDYRKLYHSKQYRTARAVFMAEHPFCAVCGALATDLDHIKAHKGNLALFWDTGNWQALCASCHSKKTATEGGGRAQGPGGGGKGY